jgi:hypothetical protein
MMFFVSFLLLSTFARTIRAATISAPALSSLAPKSSARPGAGDAYELG